MAQVVEKDEGPREFSSNRVGGGGVGSKRVGDGGSVGLGVSGECIT